MKKDTLFLHSSEHRPLSEIRVIQSLVFRIIGDEPCLVIVVDLPVRYPDNVEMETSVLYLTNRFVEQTENFANLCSFPIYVHAFIPKVVNDETITSPNELTHIAWAEVYDELPKVGIASAAAF